MASMPFRFRILGSGSAGNSAFLQSDDTRVLIDAGFSARRLNALLNQVGDSLDAIDAIFLTHEHGDHSAALKGLARHPHIRVFANASTARTLQHTLQHRIDWQLFETGTAFRFRDLEITSFAVPHDAQDPVGFRFSMGHHDDLITPQRCLAWVTDLGHAPQHIHEHLREADVVVVEANHCTDMLKADAKRPWSLKQRISGRHGHLSNQSACELLTSIASPRWQHIYLTHLSRDCNSLEAVQTAFAPLRATLNCDFSIVGPGEGTPFLEIR